VCFIDPSPEALTIGPQSLRAYLEASTSREVFEVRRIVRGIDYGPFFERYEAKGRAPYHPAVMTGLLLFGLSRGVRSLRRLEAFARENVSAWWLTGGVCPDHASIGRFVVRFGDLLEGHVFEQVTAAILKETGTSGTDLAGDGTTIPSLASRFGLLREEAAREKAAALRSQAEDLDSVPELSQRLEQKAEAYERAAEATQREVKQTGRKPKTRSVAVALADPEATNQRLKNGLPAPSYKPSVLANEERIVVAHDVQSSCENDSVDGLCEQAKRISEVEELECVRLDAGYFSGDVLKTLMDHEVDNPLVTDRGLAGELRGKEPPARFPKTKFDYDPQTDTYTCPAGETLELVKHRKVRRTKIYGGAPCSTCPLREKCTTSKKNGRQIQRYEAQEALLEAMREVMANPLARAEYAKRSSMVEPVFADLRQRHGFTRFLRAGLAKVRVEFALVVTAHNLSRLLSWRKRLGRAAFDALQALQRALRALSAPWGRQVPALIV
jgi:transposase